jgi:hypothetical protein
MTDPISIPLADLEASAAAKWNAVGDKYAGVIVGVSHQQQTDLEGKPKFFASGDPMMLYVITLQPEQGDTLALWAKGGRYVAKTGTGESMLSAIGTAVKAAGAKALTVGGRLAVAFTGEAEARPGMNAAKLFTAQYQAPVEQPQSIPADDLFSS